MKKKTRSKNIARRPQRSPTQGQGAACSYGAERPLSRFELAFGAWYANKTGRVSVAEQETAATALNDGVKVGYKKLKKLKCFEPFKRYVAHLRESATFEAREQFRSDLPAYISGHRWALDSAISAGDHRAIHAITTPAIERVWPRKESATVATQINIQLSAKQQAILESIDDDCEILPAERIDNDTPTT